MYKRVGMNYLFHDEEGVLYALEAASPASYETEALAEKDDTRFRFEKRGGEVMLIAYRGEKEVVDEARGRRVIRSIPTGTPIAEYSTKTFLDNPLNKIKKFVPECERGSGHLLSDEFREGFILFDDLFPDLEEGRSIYVSPDSERYIASVDA